MFEVILLIIVGALLITSGVLNIKGNLRLIHSYHYKRVREEDRKAFGKIVGIGSIIIGASIFISGILTAVMFFAKILALETASMIIAITGLVIGLILCFYAMFKYNKGIF